MAITKTLRRAQLLFLCAALLLNEIYQCMKFQDDISNIFSALDKNLGQTDGDYYQYTLLPLWQGIYNMQLAG